MARARRTLSATKPLWTFLALVCACSELGPSSYLGTWVGQNSALGAVTLTLDQIAADSVRGSISDATYSGPITLGAWFKDSLTFISANAREKGFTEVRGTATRAGLDMS